MIWTSFGTYVLVLTRLSGLFLVAPFFGAKSIPRSVRALLLASMALLITVLHVRPSAITAGTPTDLGILIAREAAVGMVLAVAMMICFSGLQLTGQVISHLGGISIADVFDPSTNASVPFVSQLLVLLATAVLLITGGHRQVMRALLDLFDTMPPGQVRLPPDVLEGVVKLMGLSFETAVRAGAPVAAALLLSMIVLGLLGRTLPQLNILAVGLGLNAFVMLGGLFLTIGIVMWVFQRQEEAIMEWVAAWLRAGGVSLKR